MDSQILKEQQYSDIQRILDDLKNPERQAVTPKEIHEFGTTVELTLNNINRIIWLDTEGDAYKRDLRVEKLEKLGFTVEVIGTPEKLKVVLSYSLVVTTPTYVENIFRVTDIENNKNVVGILVLVEHDFLRNFIHLTKLNKVIDVYGNFEDIFYYIVMAVLRAHSSRGSTSASKPKRRSP